MEDTQVYWNLRRHINYQLAHINTTTEIMNSSTSYDPKLACNNEQEYLCVYITARTMHYFTIQYTSRYSGHNTYHDTDHIK